MFYLKNMMCTDSRWSSFKSRGEDTPKNVFKLVAETAFGLELLHREKYF